MIAYRTDREFAHLLEGPKQSELKTLEDNMKQSLKPNDVVIDQRYQSWMFCKLMKTEMPNEFVKLKEALMSQVEFQSLRQSSGSSSGSGGEKPKNKIEPVTIYYQRTFNTVQKAEIHPEHSISIQRGFARNWFKENLVKLTAIGDSPVEIMFVPAQQRLQFWSLNRLLLSISLLILIGVGIWSCYLVKDEAKKKNLANSDPREFEMVATTNQQGQAN